MDACRDAVGCVWKWVLAEVAEVRELVGLYMGWEVAGRQFTKRPGMLTACVLVRDADEGETMLPVAAVGTSDSSERWRNGDFEGVAGYALLQCKSVRALLVAATGLLWLRPLTAEPHKAIPLSTTAVAVFEICFLSLFVWELYVLFRVQGSSHFCSDPRCWMQLVAVGLAAAVIRPTEASAAEGPHVSPLLASVSQCTLVLFRFAHLRRAAWDLGAVVAAVIPTLTLVGLCVLTFATFLYAVVPREVKGYTDLYEAWTSVLVLVTTANFPDTMLEIRRGSDLHLEPVFVFFLCFTLYFLMNLVLAVVYARYRRRAGESVKDRLELQRRLLTASFRSLSDKGGPPKAASLLRGVQRTPNGLFRKVVARGMDADGSIWVDEYHPAPPDLFGPGHQLTKRLRAFLWKHLDDMKQPPGQLTGSWRELDAECDPVFKFGPHGGFDPSVFGHASASKGSELHNLLQTLTDQGLVESVSVDEFEYRVVLEEEAHVPEDVFAEMVQALRPSSDVERCGRLYAALQLTPPAWRFAPRGLALEDWLNLLEVLDTHFWWSEKQSVLAPEDPVGFWGRHQALRAWMREKMEKGRWRKAWNWTINALLFSNIIMSYVFIALDTRQTTVDVVFGVLYFIDAWAHVWVFGFDYLRNRWDSLDFCVVHGNLALAIAAAAGAVDGPIAVIPVLLRLPRLAFRLKPFRAIFGSFLVLLPRSGRLFVLLVMVLHIYACLGEVCFGGSTKTAAQRVPGWNQTRYVLQQYEPLNFDDLWSSYLTLFHLLVVNDWPVTMEAFVLASGTRWASAFFSLFHFVVVVVVLNVLVAFVIEAFDLANTRDVLQVAPSLWEQRLLSLSLDEPRTLVVRRRQRTWDFTRAMFRDIVADFAERHKIPTPKTGMVMEDDGLEERQVTSVTQPVHGESALTVPMLHGDGVLHRTSFATPRATVPFHQSFTPGMGPSPPTPSGVARFASVDCTGRDRGVSRICGSHEDEPAGLPDPRARVGSHFVPQSSWGDLGDMEPTRKTRKAYRLERDPKRGGFCFVPADGGSFGAVAVAT